jgi:catechol 2,3-dioxygenase-like lactoylglutathione lyase family enzyme
MISPTPYFIGRTFDQICFVVKDLQEAMDYWERTFGVGRWTVFEGLSRGQTEKRYRGNPGAFEFSCAYAFAGNTLIELARHDEGESAYAEWLDAGHIGPHHVGFRVDDEDAYTKACEHFEALGFRPAMSGRYEGDGVCRWAYYDTCAQLGCFTEIYYFTDGLVKELERMRREAAAATPSATANPGI